MNNMKQPLLSRRKFLKASGTVTAAVPFITSSVVSAKESGNAIPSTSIEEKIVQTCSTFDCGGKCDIRAHIQDDRLVRISTIPDDDVDEEMPLMRACVRGRSYRKFINHPDRLKYPMKRVGKRGEGKFKRISWDEATTLIASNIKRITEEYGPDSRYLVEGSGVAFGALNGHAMAKRLMNLTGGYLPAHGGPSHINALIGTLHSYGGMPLAASSLETLHDSELIILWGHNPAETIYGNSNHFFQQLKRDGKRIVVVDPRFSDTVAAYADQWIPLRPTSDSALIEAMLYVIVTENLHNQAFIDKYTHGFTEDSLPEGVPKGESMMAYLMGEKDGVKKTPEWAESITGVEAGVIRQLARDYATAKPAALIMGLGPSRHYRGEHVTRSTVLLPAITGNIGVSGGWAGALIMPASFRFPAHTDSLENPIKHAMSFTTLTEAIASPEKVTSETGLQGAEKLNTPVKMIFSLASNYLANQNQNVNRAVKALEDDSLCEFIVVSDLYMTPSAKYADLVLPETSFAERWNVAFPWVFGDYAKISKPVVRREFERRTDYEWLAEVADKLGVGEKFTEGRNEEEWVRHFWETYRGMYPDEKLPDWNTMVEKGTHLIKSKINTVAYQAQIEDPKNNPFPTRSGKIEIFSKSLFDMKNAEIPALSHYQPSLESFADESMVKQFPLQLITWKPINRANSTFYNNPWLQEVKRQELWINPIDAQARGIEHEQTVHVFNERGTVEIPAKITPRIMPGVVGLANGAWRDVDKNGVDKGGCANTLSGHLQSPIGKGNSHKTMLVEVKSV
ncbi:molybdopterin-dependent oxidoreductase [Photobacterium sagamiensis]|uniref:DMSO/selenate family reductase complex A subunit n=1 Tax=Photobacterium sagamiensis TaxID=2910241 RepID=UPI003D13CB7C